MTYLKNWSTVSIMFVLLCTALPALPGGKSMGQNPHLSKTFTQSMKPLIDSEWKKLEPNTSLGRRIDEGLPEPYWDYSVSPAFPSVWPPDPNLILVYYVYAHGQSPRSLVDGIYVAAPWARVEVDVKREMSPKFKLLSNKIKEIGIQGVRPLREEEAAIFEKKESAEAFLGNLTTLPDETEKAAAELKKYHCTWAELNGAIVPEIRPLHKEFFKWLHCE
jgi:hypothetical protein